MLRYILLALSALSALGECAAFGGFEGLGWLWQIPVCFAGTFLVLVILWLLILYISCALVDMEKPQGKDSRWFRILASGTAGLAPWILGMKMHTRGLEQTPKSGRFLLVCNHLNDLDPVVLLHYFRKQQLAFISKRENATMFIVGKVMHKISCQMINRENDREALRTIIACTRMIQNDEVSVAVFPEGYTSRDGLLHPFRSGVFKIALKAQVPIAVCTVRNTNKVFKNIKRLRATDVHLHLLKVLQPEELAGMTTVEVGNLVHKIMADDLGSELVAQETT